MQSMFAQSIRNQVRRHPIILTSATALAGTYIFVHNVETSTRFSQKPKLLPRQYNKHSIENYWYYRPKTILIRISSVLYEVVPLIAKCAFDFKIRNNSLDEKQELEKEFAKALRKTFTKLGPAFVKIGQQLSIRPDLIPPNILYELQKLCDSVDPIADEVALKELMDELKIERIEDVFDDLHLVAAASLGQVYKANVMVDGKMTPVAIKVQRPDMREKVSLDLFLMFRLAAIADSVLSVITKQSPYHAALVDTFAKGSYMELDYENEAQNQKYLKQELHKRKCDVKIPAVHDTYTTQRVITTEWIDGIRLADASPDVIYSLIPTGIDLFITQLLDIGLFHSDPHPGNLYVTNDNKLCLLDFGLCAEVDAESRQAITSAILHLLTGDFDTLISRDAKTLGFLPEDFDTTPIKPMLSKILSTGLLDGGSNLHLRKKRLMDISNELNVIFFQYPFSVPPFFALITRGLGLLEGIALCGDPDFDIFRASSPFVRKRAFQMLLC